jgi:hypothetical protein
MSFLNTPNTSWNKLQKDSENFQKPIHYPNAFDYRDEFESAIHDLLQLYATNENVKNLSPQLRLYVNQQTVDIHSYFNLSKVIKFDQSVEDWGKRVFNGQNYILVINCIERFSETLSGHFAKLMAPRLENCTPDEVSYRITLFIGNSGFTPFGAHIDLSGLDVLHFYLGPGSKAMALWEENKFKVLSKSEEKHYYDFEKYLEYGDKYELKKGDVLFFPADKFYHVGEYHNFSIASAVGMIKESSNSFFTKTMGIWNEDIKQYLPTHEEKSNKPSEHISKNVLNTTVLEIIEEYKLKKESNTFMNHRPILKNLRPIFLINKTVQLNHPFRILINSERGQIFSRGRKLYITLDKETELIIVQLNKDEVISCKKEMPENTLALITWFFNTGGVIFSKKNSSLILSFVVSFREPYF